MTSFSLWLFYCSDQYKLGTENMKAPFHLLLTCNLAFSLIFIYFSERAESNEKFFPRNQGVILSVSLHGWLLSNCYRECYAVFAQKRSAVTTKNVSYFS